jgi:hypothetical protein
MRSHIVEQYVVPLSVVALRHNEQQIVRGWLSCFTEKTGKKAVFGPR